MGDAVPEELALWHLFYRIDEFADLIVEDVDKAVVDQIAPHVSRDDLVIRVDSIVDPAESH